jgi:hypothetical protein
MRPAFDNLGPSDPLDFDNDGLFTVEDLDALTAAIRSDAGNLDFDLDGNLKVDILDLQAWLAEAANKNSSQAPYAVGDTNLDGIVDAADLETVTSNLFTSSSRWSRGNVNADHVIDVYDFNRIFSNITAPSDTAAVPEPVAGIGTLITLLVGFRRVMRDKGTDMCRRAV